MACFVFNSDGEHVNALKSLKTGILGIDLANKVKLDNNSIQDKPQ